MERADIHLLHGRVREMVRTPLKHLRGQLAAEHDDYRTLARLLDFGSAPSSGPIAEYAS